MVFIPAYRCAAQIERVIGQFSGHGADLTCIDRVVVVDNQSPDETIPSATAALAGLPAGIRKIILRNSDNYGLGGSHKVAMRHAKEVGMDYLVVLHGDDQANFGDILPHLVSGKAFEADCFLGSRFQSGARRQGYSGLRTFGNVVYNFLFSIVAGKQITDLGSGLNLYNVSRLDIDAIEHFPDDLTFNYVMLLWSLYQRHDVRFFPISWREEDQRSNVKLFQQALRVLGLLLRRAINAGAFFAADHRATPRAAYRSVAIYQG
jgi:glycosyltransferase involved in cell wall biosynthesis